MLDRRVPSRAAVRTLVGEECVGGRKGVVLVGPGGSEGGASVDMVREGEEAVLARSDRPPCSGCTVV